MRFRDRAQAGQRLAQVLTEKYGAVDGVVYALPRGGVVLGAEIAHALRMPLDLIITRKIGHPANPELAIGAVTEGGEFVADGRWLAQIDPEWLAREIDAERQEAYRRRQTYLGGKPSLSATSKTAILVDDGVATGFTMQAAIREARKQHPHRLVVAVPIVPADTAETFARDVDDLVVLDAPFDYLGAVSAYYDRFAQVSDEEVVALLRKQSSDLRRTRAAR